MRTLRLVALSDDGKNLILAAEGIDGAEGFLTSPISFSQTSMCVYVLSF